ncbi:S26 family signal peptidase [Sulfurospirillum cavolei]|uniref:S26 family signal peptidase n=1 Tax=Sulfurospirillum cavolei TaxID=366522 RepID=UPI003FA2E8F0
MVKLKMATIGIAFTVALFGCVSFAFGLVINLTESMPQGLYQIVDDTNISKNDLIVFTIPHKSEQLLKKVVAAENDSVVINQNGVYVNDALLQNSKIFNIDSKGNPLTPHLLNKTLKRGEFLALGEHVQSYDGRYFGTIHMQDNHIKKVHLIFTWSEYGKKRNH